MLIYPFFPLPSIVSRIVPGVLKRPKESPTIKDADYDLNQEIESAKNEGMSHSATHFLDHQVMNKDVFKTTLPTWYHKTIWAMLTRADRDIETRSRLVGTI